MTLSNHDNTEEQPSSHSDGSLELCSLLAAAIAEPKHDLKNEHSCKTNLTQDVVRQLSTSIVEEMRKSETASASFLENKVASLHREILERDMASLSASIQALQTQINNLSVHAKFIGHHVSASEDFGSKVEREVTLLKEQVKGLVATTGDVKHNVEAKRSDESDKIADLSNRLLAMEQSHEDSKSMAEKETRVLDEKIKELVQEQRKTQVSISEALSIIGGLKEDSEKLNLYQSTKIDELSNRQSTKVDELSNRLLAIEQRHAIHTFKVNGNRDTYYPVAFHTPERDQCTSIQVWRRVHWDQHGAGSVTAEFTFWPTWWGNYRGSVRGFLEENVWHGKDKVGGWEVYVGPRDALVVWLRGDLSYMYRVMSGSPVILEVGDENHRMLKTWNEQISRIPQPDAPIQPNMIEFYGNLGEPIDSPSHAGYKKYTVRSEKNLPTFAR